jgi:GntR family transcriptional regulator/MocR family aminotransferase
MDADEIAGALKLDKASDIPLYAQVRDLLLKEIREARLAEGRRLPPVRRLATLTGVNIMTVARAYKELAELGAIAGRGARGTFVLPRRIAAAEAPATAEKDLRTLRADYANRDVDTFRRMVQMSDVPGMIPFTRAYPDASVIDTSSFEGHLKKAIDARPDYAYSYISPAGLPSLRRAIAKVMRRARGLDLASDDIVITSGGQQALNLVAQLLLKPGDVVLVERPTYFGALDLFRNLGVEPVGVDLESDGPDLGMMESLIESRSPKLLFLMPTFQNPTGLTTSLEKRKAILELSRRRGIAIIEDDCGTELRYRGKPIPSIKSLASDEDPVFYIVGMGKAYIPGIRLGFVAAPTHRVSDIIKMKSISDLHTSPLYQDAFQHYLASDAASKNLALVCSKYRDLLDTVVSELERNMPDGTGLVKPQGGLNLWVTLPSGIDSIDFFLAALQRNVSILVGAHLFPENPDQRSFRLSFGFPDKQATIRGVRALAAAVKDLARPASSRFAAVV